MQYRGLGAGFEISEITLLAAKKKRPKQMLEPLLVAPQTRYVLVTTPIIRDMI